MFHALSQVTKSDNKKRKPVSREKVSQLNSDALRDVVIREDQVSVSEEEVIVGDEVLDLPNTPQYNIHFPFRRGDVNLHSDIGGSLTSILKGVIELVKPVTYEYDVCSLHDNISQIYKRSGLAVLRVFWVCRLLT